MGNLTNKYVKDTYDGLLKLQDETSGVKATLQPIQDGLGNDLPIKVSQTEVVITGSFSGDGSNLTGITSTNAVSASHAIFAESALSASYAPDTTDTGSLVSDVALVTPFNNQIEVTKGDGSSSQFTIDNVTSASYADLASTASYAENVDLPSGLVSGSGQIVELGFATTSSLTSLSSSIASTDLGQDGRLDSLESSTASLNSYTSSQGDIRGDFNSFTSSQAGIDSAQDGRLDSLEEKTGSYATTGSNVFTGLQQINNDLVIQGNLYVSGSEVIVSSSTLIVGDREIELNANRTIGNSGIIVYDVVSPEGTGSLQYDVTNNYWIAGQYGSEQRIITSDMTSSMSVASAVSASHSETSDNAISSSHAIYAESSLSSSHSETSDNAISASHAIFAETTLISEYSNNTIVYGKNMTGVEILKGTPLYFSGSGTAGNLVGVYPADAGNPSRMPAGGVAGENISSGAEGVVLIDGFINGVNTSLFAAGDEVYVAVGGGYTNVVPTGSANQIQKLGNVEKSDVSNGSGVINGPGAARSVPNIQEGYIWVGNVNGVATPTSTGSFARRDEVNTFTQNQIFQGTLSATQLTLTGGAGYDLIVTQSVKVGTTLDAGSGVRVGDIVGQYTAMDSYAVASERKTTTDLLGLTVDNGGYGNTGWSGPGIYGNDPTNTFPVFIGFQDKASWTDGRITLLKNTDISGSLIVTNGITGSLFGTASYATEALSASYAPMPDVSYFATTGSNTFIGNQIITGSIFQSSSLPNEFTRVQIANSNKVFGGEANTLLSLVGDSEGIVDFYVDGGNYDTLNIKLTQNGGLTFRDWNGGGYSNWLTIPTNTGANPAPQFQRGLGITGSVNISGNTIANGSILQNFTAPATNQEVGFIDVSGAAISGKPYNRVFFGIADYPSFGQTYEDYFAIEYYDSLSYNFGSEFNVNGKQAQLLTAASGSGNLSIIQTRDNYDGTSWSRMTSANKVEILSPEIRIGRALGSDILIEGSVQQWVSGITINSATASVDFSKSNFQTLTLAGGVATHIQATNMSPGQSVVIEITQDGSSAGTVTFDSSITFPGGTPYAPTTTLGGKDVLTLVSFDGSVARGQGQNDFS